MGLCGSFRCGCGITTDGSIDITGSGGPGDPFELSLGQDRPAVVLRHSVAQNVASGSTFQALTFDTETIDTDGFHSSGAPTRITIPTGLGGLYLVAYTFAYFASTGGFREAHMRRSGGSGDRRGESPIGYGSDTYRAVMSGHALLRLVDGDYLEVFTAQNSGGVVGVQGVNSASNIIEFSAVKLGE